MLGLLLLATAALVAAMVSLLFGLRGRRVNGHPVCRRCRFDLEGVYPGNETCPECGVNLSKPRAIRIGVRRKRRKALVLAALFGAVCLGSGLLAGSQLASGFNLNQHKPVWMLLWEAEGSWDALANSALDELVDRQVNGRLRTGEESRIIERSLAYQGDVSKPWRTGWGMLVEDAWTGGRLGEAQRERYARQGFLISVLPRRRVRIGDDMPIEMVIERRLALSQFLMATLHHEGTRFGREAIRDGPDHLTNYGDIPFSMLQNPNQAMPSETRRLIDHAHFFTDADFSNRRTEYEGKGFSIDGEAGVRELRSRWSVLISVNPRPSTGGGGVSGTSMGRTLFSSPRPWSEDPDWVDGLVRPIPSRGSGLPQMAIDAAVVAFRLECAAEVEVVPRDVKTVELVTDPALVAETKSLLQQNMRVTIGPGWRRSNEISVSWSVSDYPPVDLLFDVFLRHGENEHQAGAIAWLRESSSTRRHHYPPSSWAVRTASAPAADGLSLTEADIVLRPSPRRALATTEIDRIIGEEIVLERVAISPAPSMAGWGPPGQIGTASGTAPATPPGKPVTRLGSFSTPMTHFTPGGGGMMRRAAAVRMPYVYTIDREDDLFVERVPDGSQPASTGPLHVIVKAGDGHDLAVVGDTLLCTYFGGLKVYSLDDPETPSLVTTVRPPELKGSTTLLIDGDRALTMAPGLIVVYDISDPREPKILGVSNAGPGAINGGIVGSHLIVYETRGYGSQRQGLGVFDISDPGAIQEVAFMARSDWLIHLFPLEGDRLLCVGENESIFFDVSDPASPVEGASFPHGSRAAALVRAHGADFLVTTDRVHRIEGDTLHHVHTIHGFGGTVDGMPYHGGSEGDVAAMALGGNTTVIRIEPDAAKVP